MRTILKVVWLTSLITWFILHFTCPQITHTYIGTVYGNSIIAEKKLCVNSGSHVKYVFQYKDKDGNIRDSNSIEGNSDDSQGFITDSGTWVEKQLLEKGKVYIPGWHIGMIIEFIFLCFLLGFFLFTFFFTVICSSTEDHDYGDCRRCDCPMCIFSQETLEDDEPFFNAIKAKIDSFFNINNAHVKSQ